jgi:hypothetical protein
MPIMRVGTLERKFSLRCEQCDAIGVPLRVESQTESTLALALRCSACSREWTTQGDLPVFLAWVKPDRRRRDASTAVHITGMASGFKTR